MAAFSIINAAFMEEIMRNKKLVILLVVCIAAVISVTVYRGVSKKEKNPQESVVTTGQAARAVALLKASEEECGAARNHFAKGEEWYTPYMNLMYDRGYFNEKQIMPSGKEAASAFTYEKLGYLFENMDITDKEILSYVKNNKAAKAITNSQWAVIFEKLADYTAAGQTQEEEFNVVATVSNVSSLEPWNVVTTIGNYIFTGLSMDYYIDKRIKVITKENQILCVKEIVSREIIYPNAFVTSMESGKMNVFISGVIRTFEIDDGEVSATNAVMDIRMKNGRVSDYTEKENYVSGKLLKYTDTTVDVEGQGAFEIGEGFRIYKTYGNIETRTLYDLIVGYDVQKFVVEDGKVCAILIDRNFVAQNIRVVIKNNGFQDIYHDNVIISSDKEFEFSYGKEKRVFQAGEEYIITQDSRYLEDGTLKISAAGSDGKITVKSLERGYGMPSYRGSIEIMKTEGGLVIINELPLEEYLYAVVPSEMPYTYNAEALKAQAVCARSYAYRHMLSNAYAYLGAHVDDSTAFQVYNNSSEQATASQAVDDTYGQIMTCKGEPISAFFYSTSCGSGTDALIWGGSGYEYIKGRLLSLEASTLDLTDEAQFKMFIMNNYNTFDQEYSWYRWNVIVPLENITQGVNEKLASLYASGPEKVLTLEGEDYVSRDISSVGHVLSIETGTRGTGGVLNEIVIHGDEATVMIKTESFIRNIFNLSGLAIHKNDGSTVDTFTSLPSAFFAAEEVREGETLTGYQLYGGGYGHGAGMSQNGANTMGNNGMGYQDILNFFYNNIVIESIY